MELIAYYRVSTQVQGESGLGLDAQRRECERYAEGVGGRFIQVFMEVESGGNDDRPELAKAIAAARRSGARLVIAKLDRLSRDVAFTTDILKNSGIDIVACDAPGADKMMLQMKSVFAEYERDMISRRTKDALAAFKREKRVPRRWRKMYPDGVPAEIVEKYAGKLGSAIPGLWAGREHVRLAAMAKARERSNHVRRSRALSRVKDLVGGIVLARKEGQSYQTIAESLNAQGHRGPGGGPWYKATVRRVLSMTAQVT